MNGSGPNEERPSPLSAECRNIGGVSHHGRFQSIQTAQMNCRNFEHFTRFRTALYRFVDRVARGPRVTHQPDHDLGSRLVGDDVGRAAAAQRSYVESAWAEYFVYRQ